MKKVLITGAAGFIGYNLAKELQKEEYELVLLDNFSRGVEDELLATLNKSKNVKFISMDIGDKDLVMKLGDDFDYIYHFAAIIGVQNVLKKPYDVLTKNMILLLNVIELAKKQKNLEKLIFTSTSEVYAGTLEYFQMKIPTPEDTPLAITDLSHPRTSYMLSKIYGEAVLRQSGIPFIIIRPHNIYGPRMGMSHVIPELLKKAYFNSDNKLEVYSVEHKRTFCYIDDAVNMIKLLAQKKECINEEFNIGNEYPEVTIEELAQAIINTVGKELSIVPMPSTSGSPKRRCPDMKKTKEIIAYESAVSLSEGIIKTFKWYEKNVFIGNEVSEK